MSAHGPRPRPRAFRAALHALCSAARAGSVRVRGPPGAHQAPPGPRQQTFDDLGRPLQDMTFVVVDLETTGGSPATVLDHRDRCGQGARRRGARRVPDPGASRGVDPAVHLRPHRHHRCDGRRRPAAGRRHSPRSWSSPAAACWSPTTRRSTSGSCAPACERTGPAWPAFESVDTARAGPADPDPRRDPQLQAGDPGRVFRVSDPALPPGAGRRAGHRRRAARAVRAARQPRRHVDGGAAHVLRPGAGGRAPQAAPGRDRARRAGRLPLPGRAGAGRSTSAPRAMCAPGCATTSRPASSAPGWPRWSRSPSGSTPCRARTRWRRRYASCG